MSPGEYPFLRMSRRTVPYPVLRRRPPRVDRAIVVVTAIPIGLGVTGFGLVTSVSGASRTSAFLGLGL